MSVSQRERTKQYIKEGLRGYERTDGISIPGARRIYRGFDASYGYDLRHIERWPAARLKAAREHIQSINTLTGRPFAVIVPRSKKQRIAAQKYSGQDLPRQKEMIVAVQDPKIDKIVFRNNKVAVERTMRTGSKAIQQRYLFEDYLVPGEAARLLKEELQNELGKDLPDDRLEEIEEELSDLEEAIDSEPTLDMPVTFMQMREVTKRMLKDMPKKQYGRDVYYTILTTQYGPVGESILHEDVLSHLAYYHSTYGMDKQHVRFAEQVIGFQMVGTFVSATAYERERQRNKEKRKRLNKLRFSKPRKR